MREIKELLNRYFSINEEWKASDKELIEMQKTMDEALDSLTVSAQKLSDMPKGTDVSDPIFNIYKQIEKIKFQYIYRIDDLIKYRDKLFNDLQTLRNIIEQAKLTTLELKIAGYKHKNRLTDWQIANIVSYSDRQVRRIYSCALWKIRNIK